MICTRNGAGRRGRRPKRNRVLYPSVTVVWIVANVLTLGTGKGDCQDV